jgi:hypothetical protein
MSRGSGRIEMAIIALFKMEREKVDQRVTLVTRKSWLEAVDLWRSQHRPILSRNEAIRRLVDQALAAEETTESGGGPGTRRRPS